MPACAEFYAKLTGLHRIELNWPNGAETEDFADFSTTLFPSSATTSTTAAASGELLKMEVNIRKGAWQTAWRYPAYLWSLRWVYAVKKTRRLVYAVYPRIPPNTPLAAADAKQFGVNLTTHFTKVSTWFSLASLQPSSVCNKCLHFSLLVVISRLILISLKVNAKSLYFFLSWRSVQHLHRIYKSAAQS